MKIRWKEKRPQPPGHESDTLTTEPPGLGSKQKEFTDDNFSFDLNDRMFSKRVENTGKGEIACYKQFLHFPQSFQKTYTADT